MTDRVQPGQPLKIPARTWNDLLDVKQQVTESAINTKRDPLNLLPSEASHVALVKNVTGQDVARFRPVGLSRAYSPFELTGGQVGIENYVQSNALVADKPYYPDKWARWGVTVEPIKYGAFGRAVIAGVAFAEVMVMGDEAFSPNNRNTQCTFQHGSCDVLVSSYDGWAKLLHGRQNLSEGQTQFAMIYLGAQTARRQFQHLLTPTNTPLMPPRGLYSAQIIAVGGGGGGAGGADESTHVVEGGDGSVTIGPYGGGGGGGGGTEIVNFMPAGQIDVTFGAGGVGNSSTGQTAGNGQDTTVEYDFYNDDSTIKSRILIAQGGKGAYGKQGGSRGGSGGVVGFDRWGSGGSPGTSGGLGFFGQGGMPNHFPIGEKGMGGSSSENGRDGSAVLAFYGPWYE